MGGDSGIAVTLPGVLDALHADPLLKISLFGDEEALHTALKERQVDRLTLVHCPTTVDMDEKPASVLRRKTDSSLAQAIGALKNNEASAVVSAGNTAAMVAFGVQMLGTLPKVERPALCTSLPHAHGRTWMLDMGATLEPDAEQLLQFARMGSCQARLYDGLDDPRVGLLNVGAEITKGTASIREAAALLENCHQFHYAGFAEGIDLCSGRFDVIVCDGFVGNVALKSAEGVSNYMGELLGELLKGTLMTRLGLFLISRELKSWRVRIDPAEYNGASLLGLNGLVVKSRGGTNVRGFRRAIEMTAELARQDIVNKIRTELEGN